MKKLLAKIRKILHDRRTRQMLTRIVSVTAAIVVFITTYALVLPAITMESEANCGIEAHQHDESCYEDQLICGEIESPGHHHSEACYEVSKALICEEQEHQHDDSCFDESGNLTCDQPEHTHDDTCYKESRDLTCDIPESDGHQHSSACYERVLTCGKEIHTHSPACYAHASDSASSASTGFTAVATTELGSSGATVSASTEIETESGESDVPSSEASDAWTTEKNVEGEASSSTTTNVSTTAATTAGSSSTAAAAATASTGNTAFDSAAAENTYIPQLEPVIFEQLLTKDTGIYYYHAEEGQEAPESSADIADWKRVNDDTELTPADLLRVYLRYTIPAGILNPTNDIARYRLPANLHLTDQQMETINTTVNGVANQYVSLDTLEITDTEKYNTYLGIEATEGTRKPSDNVDEYFADHPDLEGQEYINAVVRAENVFDDTTGEYAGQDLVFTFSPYTIQKNQHEYDADGQPTKAGQKVDGWLCFDLHMDQIDWSEPVISTIDNSAESIQDNATPTQDESVETAESSGSSDTTETIEKPSSETKEETSASSSDSDALNTNTLTEKKESSAEIIFASKDKALKIDEISTELHLVEVNAIETEKDTTPDEQDQTADDSTDSAKPEMTDAETADDTTSEGEADKNDSADETAATAEDQPESKIEVNAETYPAVSFQDTITVQAGSLNTDNETSGQAIPAETAITVSVIAEEETFPLGTTMQLGTVEDMDTVASAVEGAVEGQTRGFHAVDISFHNADGEEIEPLKSIKVSMTSDAIKQAVEDSSTAPVVVHVENSAEAVDPLNPTDYEITADFDDFNTSSDNDTDADKNSADAYAYSESVAENNENMPTATIVETTEASSTDSASNANENTDTLSFDAGAFSVYAIVYTVDFHYEVDGKNYEFSIPGGGFISLEHLVEVLGIATDDANTENGAETPGDFVGKVPGENTSGENGITYEEAIKLNEVEVSEATKRFVADVESVEFSNPELVWVGKVDSAATVGGLKEANGLEVEYSAELTEEQIAEINAQTAEAGDWALISVHPFTSEETLTITMKNQEQFVVKVTDALHVDPDELVGKEIVIYDKNEKTAMTSNYATDYRTHFNTIPYTERTATPDSAHWTVEKYNNNYYLKSNTGKYLKIDEDNVSLVDYGHLATPLGITEGGQPDYLIYAANNPNAKLTYCENNEYDGFFSAPNGANGAGTTRQWLGIDYAINAAEPVGDWMLYFDDDFDEITIHVGETISLRPYQKWEWKEGNTDVQTAHWNIGGKNDNFWNQIRRSDENGDRKAEWDDGGTGDNTAAFHWTAYVKKDTELVTHYWAVQGRATQTGVYYLKNTKNDKTIKVNVVEGDPVNQPQTVTDTVDIKVNLFDYDLNYILDPTDDSNKANKIKNESINYDGKKLYFMSSGGGDAGNPDSNRINRYTNSKANTGIVNSSLNNDGYPQLAMYTGDTGNLKYLFDTSDSATTWHGGKNNDAMIAYPNVNGMFRKDSDGYYYYNSNTNYYYYNPATGESKLYEHTYTQTSSADKGSLENDKPIGFFPFHEYDATDNLYVNQNHALNHHVGMSMEIPFKMNSSKTDENGKPIKFEFTGDDDLWVFVEWEDAQGTKHSKLVLDVGGIHQPVYGYIDFTNDNSSSLNSLGLAPGVDYKLKVYYLERGGCDSNLAVRFNIPLTNVGDVPFTKRDALTNDPLPGAVFGLYTDESCSEANKLRQAVSDENGHVLFHDVSIGTYFMKEITPPEGYHASTAVYRVEVKAKNNAEITLINSDEARNDYSYRIDNKPIQLTVKKVWLGEQSSNTPNVVYFKLYKKGSPDGEITDKVGYVNGRGYVLSSDNNWTAAFKDLEDGQYYVVEENLPGYIPKYVAKIVDTDEDDAVKDSASDAVADEQGDLTILNKPVGYLQIQKKVTYNGSDQNLTTAQKSKLAGEYKFKIYKKEQCAAEDAVQDPNAAADAVDKDLIVTIMIGTDGKAIVGPGTPVKLLAGNYWIKEVESSNPGMFPVDNPIAVTVSKDHTSDKPVIKSFTNNYDENNGPDKISIDIEKKFSGLDNASQVPRDFEVLLQYTLSGETETVTLHNTELVTGENGEKITWSQSADGFTWHWKVTGIPSEAKNFKIKEQNYNHAKGYDWKSAALNGTNITSSVNDWHELTITAPAATLSDVTNDRRTSDSGSNTVFYLEDDDILLSKLTANQGTLVISKHPLNLVERDAVVKGWPNQGGFKTPPHYFSIDEHPNGFSYGDKKITFGKKDGRTTVKFTQNASAQEAVFAVTYKSDEARNNANLLNTYEEVPITIDIIKVEQDNTSRKLPGAIFTLRQIADTAPTENGTLQTLDGTTPTDSVPTDDNGKTSFNNLTHGYYEISEKTAPDGYVLSADLTFYFKIESGVVKWLVKGTNKPSEWAEKEEKAEGELVDYEPAHPAIGADPENNVVAQSAANAAFTVENTPGAALPNTGGPGTRLIYLLGLMLACTAGAGLLLRKHRSPDLG